MSAGRALATLRSPFPDPAIDISLALATFAMTLALLSPQGAAVSTGGSSNVDWLAVALAGLASVPILVWRRGPLLAFAVTALVTTVLTGLGYGVGVALAP